MATSNQGQITFLNEPELAAEEAQPRTTGILPSQEISKLIDCGSIRATPTINPEHVQPASLDLRLGDMAHRVRASFLPGPNATVADKIKVPLSEGREMTCLSKEIVCRQFSASEKKNAKGRM